MRAPTFRTSVLAALMGGTLALSGCTEAADPGDDVDTPTTASTPDTSPADAGSSAGEPSSSAGAPGSPSPSAAPTAATGDRTVAVYWVGSTPRGPRLFREFRRAPGPDALAGAVDLLTSGEALDPDYRSLLPAGSVESVVHDRDAGRVVVELRDDAWTTPAPGTSRRRARLAVQQLVHTAQAAVQERVPVVVTLGGVPTTLLGVDTREGVRQADPLDVLALVSVTAPEQGSVLEGSFRARGVASAFEATVPWELRRGSEVVLEGFATAEGWMDRLYPWETDEIDVSGLEPGRYTFVASTGDPSGGEGPGPTVDTKEVEVR
ncbi:Gmad2 immunoglobulin-like domain-containing protein [Nocardioides solisilvae]|uniref:Gmad2 immunoglobulin-like domain-containing protein n=1 Tax=Nocardioides solisilvae TaxID=1542435 RepID=UPI000D749B3A|nr:Gmad2 immunoglobulin-like domain-containing protein [Nocardioides solisilvae]